jgi:hypothetical protein
MIPLVPTGRTAFLSGKMIPIEGENDCPCPEFTAARADESKVEMVSSISRANEFVMLIDGDFDHETPTGKAPERSPASVRRASPHPRKLILGGFGTPSPARTNRTKAATSRINTKIFMFFLLFDDETFDRVPPSFIEIYRGKVTRCLCSAEHMIRAETILVAGSGLFAGVRPVVVLPALDHSLGVPDEALLPTIDEPGRAHRDRFGNFALALEYCHSTNDSADNNEIVQLTADHIACDLGVEVPLASPVRADSRCCLIVQDKECTIIFGELIQPARVKEWVACLRVQNICNLEGKGKLDAGTPGGVKGRWRMFPRRRPLEKGLDVGGYYSIELFRLFRRGIVESILEAEGSESCGDCCIIASFFLSRVIGRPIRASKSFLSCGVCAARNEMDRGGLGTEPEDFGPVGFCMTDVEVSPHVGRDDCGELSFHSSPYFGSRSFRFLIFGTGLADFAFDLVGWVES